MQERNCTDYGKNVNEKPRSQVLALNLYGLDNALEILLENVIYGRADKIIEQQTTNLLLGEIMDYKRNIIRIACEIELEQERNRYV